MTQIGISGNTKCAIRIVFQNLVTNIKWYIMYVLMESHAHIYNTYVL